MSDSLVVIADTHGRDGHRLSGRMLEAVVGADLVVHAGDFVTESAFEALRSVCTLEAVFGNNDPASLRETLPATRVVEWNQLRLAVTHGDSHSSVSRELFGREQHADLVVVGHSHRPMFEAGEPPVLNPGSYAEPRQYVPAYAEIGRTETGYEGRIRSTEGALLEEFRL